MLFVLGWLLYSQEVSAINYICVMVITCSIRLKFNARIRNRFHFLYCNMAYNHGHFRLHLSHLLLSISPDFWLNRPDSYHLPSYKNKLLTDTNRVKLWKYHSVNLLLMYQVFLLLPLNFIFLLYSCPLILWFYPTTVSSSPASLLLLLSGFWHFK